MGMDTFFAIGTRELFTDKIRGPDPALPCRIGAGTTSQGLNSENDLLVSGDLEVDGAAYCDGALTVSSTLSTAAIVTGANTAVGTNFNIFYWYPQATGQTVDSCMFAVGASARLILVNEYTDRAYDFAHTNPTNPTIFIHSANQSATEWISISHDQTDGVIDCGTGTLNLGATGNVNFAGATHTGTGDTATNGYVTMEVAGASIKFATIA